MFANRLHVFLSLALAAAVGVSAQIPGLDACLLSCVNQAVSNSTCTSFTDVSCVCSSSSFQSTAAACLQANCTTADQDTALQLRNEQCGTSSSAAPAGSGTSAKAASTGASASSPTPSKSSAAPIVAEQLPFLTAVVAIAGVALGGAFAL